MGNPFDKLRALRDSLPAGNAPPQAGPPVPAEAPVAKAPARAVLRYERKGRGGKEVTCVDQLGLDPDGLDQWCRDARKALGCGGTVEGSALVLSGDQRSRLTPWLLARGVKKVSGGA